MGNLQALISNLDCFWLVRYVILAGFCSSIGFVFPDFFLPCCFMSTQNEPIWFLAAMSLSVLSSV